MNSVQNDRGLIGKRALITGAGRGIGRGIAVELARCGANVAVNDLRESDDTAETVRQCQDAGKDSGGGAWAVAADVSDRDAVAEMVDACLKKMGGLDIAVSNAAYSDRHAMIEQEYAEFDKTIEVSMMGAYNVVRAVAEVMVKTEAGKADGGASIVVISSPHAHMPIPGAMAYNMAKAGNDQMAKTAACELAVHGIRVNLIHPGWIDTPGERKFFTEKALQAAAEKIPMGRLGQPSDLARGVVFLCDPRNSYVTGSTLTIDGGIQLPWREMFRLEEARKAR